MENNENQENGMSKEEIIGYHKGAVNTLLSERTELFRIIQITEKLINAHAAELEKLGVKLQSGQSSQNSRGSKTP